METCGEYELERAIGWGRRSTFFSARAINDRGPALIVIRRARTVERNHRHAFLRAAAEQQTAVGAGCRRLAPILAFDCDESGFAFYATTRYETSLAEFLEAECKADSALLREIVTSILGALAELHEKSRRAHGNLTPGNILLDPQGRIFLTDLAPSAKDATTADDLFALGKLIYQLVRRNARVGELNPPLDYSPAWTESLGDDAEGWLAFTNRLLDKPQNTSPGAIPSAIRDLKSLAGLAAKAAKAAVIVSPLESGATAVQVAVRRPPPKKRSPVPVILAALVLLGGGGGGFVYYKKQQAKKAEEERIEKEKERIRNVQKLLPGAIQNLAEELKQMPPGKFEDGTVQSLLIRMGEDLGNSTSAEGATSQVNLRIRNWDLPDKMKAQAKVWADAPREWTRLAGELQSASEVDAKGEISIVVQFENAIAASKDAAELDDQWEIITRALIDHKAAGNARLPAFTPWVDHEIRNAPDLKAALDRAQAAAKTLGEVSAFQAGMGSRVLWARFEKEVPELLQVPTNDLMPGWPAKWISEAKARVAPEKTKRDLWETKLVEFEKLILRLNPKDPKLPDWKKKLADSRAAATEAMETDVAKIDADLATKFNTLELPAEKAHKVYEKFLADWKQKASDLSIDAPGAKLQADGLVTNFTAVTTQLLKDYPEYKGSLGDPAAMTGAMRDRLAMPDRIKLQFSAPGWTDVTPAGFDKAGAAFTFTKAGIGTVPMFFMALDKEYAMAAWETPLILARCSGVTTPGLTRDKVTGLLENGPQTRNNDFTPAATWLWKYPQDLMTSAARNGNGSKIYLHPEVLPGDISAFLPVTWVTFTEATEMAKALGGQLPTAEQWKSAYGKKLAGPEKRLRSDAAWTKQNGLLKDWAVQKVDPFLLAGGRPDKGSFSTQLKESDTDKGAAGGTDNKLWLTGVATSADWTVAKGFTHLVGNAAEWVSDNGKPAVIGASVVSPKIPVDTAYPMSSSAAYFDVTFRLVVKLGEGGAGVGLQQFKDYARDEMKLPPKPVAR